MTMSITRDRNEEFRLNLWLSLSSPIRPSQCIVDRVMYFAGKPGRALVLGATPEYVAALARSGCAEITVVDTEPVSFKVMFRCLRMIPKQVRIKERDWLSFVLESKDKWDCILMDCGLLFVKPEYYISLLAGVKRVLRDEGGVFVSRQIVKGKRDECRQAWLSAIHKQPCPESISILYLANALIAADYGQTQVSYRKLRRLAKYTLHKLITFWSNELRAEHRRGIEYFLNNDTHGANSSLRMRYIPKEPHLLNAYRSSFGNIYVEQSECPISSYYRIITAQT